MVPGRFGTNGIREVVGHSLTPEFATRVAEAIGSVIPPGKPVVVGWDGRTSSPGLERIVSGALALTGHHVVEVGLLPTPAIQYLVPRIGAQLGVIVTASHNPPEFNGFKCVAADGLWIPRTVEEAIEERIARGDVRHVPFDQVGDIMGRSGGAEEYVRGILACVDVPRIRARHFSVVVDVANGTAAVTSPVLLKQLGCRVRTLNGHIDGTFPGRMSEPTEDHLQDLLASVPAFGADLGIAHDGDADRTVLVDRTGHYVPGATTLSLLARAAVERHGGGVVVSPVTASQSLEEAIRPFGGRVVYTRVGNPNVTRAMLAERAVFGGEESGGMVFPEFQLASDGGMAAAATLNLLAATDRPLEELVGALPRYELVKEKLPCPPERREQAIAAAAQRLQERAERVERLDGVKVYRKDGWILIRPSGTEPLVRVFAESRDPDRARALAREAVEALRAALT